MMRSSSILPNRFAINDKSGVTGEKRQISGGESNAVIAFGRYLRGDFSRSYFAKSFFLVRSGATLMSRMNALLLACITLAFADNSPAEDVRQQLPVRVVKRNAVTAAVQSDVAQLGEDDFVSALQESTKPATVKPEKTDKPTLKDSVKRSTPLEKAAPPKTTPAPQSAPANNPPLVAEQLQPFNNNPQFAANNQRYIGRLARTPDMFGDSFIPTNAHITTLDGERTSTDLPVAGGSRRFKNEYARALPTDRVFGFYHYFDSALQTRGNGPGSSASKSVNRFTLGIEKTFFDGNDSIEIRMPFTSQVSLATPGLAYNADGIGDLVVSVKHLLYFDNDQALSLGLAVSAPTGSDLRVQRFNTGVAPTTIDLSNQAVHLVPYLAYQAAIDESWFFNGFLQFDTPTNGNSVRVTDSGTTETLRVTDQTLLYLDAAVGYWWWHDEEAEFLNGLASIFEVHYTTALNNATSVSSAQRVISFGDSANRFNVVNVTLGLNASLARNTQLRAACVLPLRDGTNRFFDSEFTVGLIYRR